MTSKKTRGNTERFKLNEDFIFGAPRCIRCGRPLKKGEFMICNSCKLRQRFFTHLYMITK
jgi:hypothetical protein